MVTGPSTITEHQDRPTCCHYWVIQPAAGPLSLGVCQVCGDNREFKNYLEYPWDHFDLAFRAGLDGSENTARETDDQEESVGDEEG